jgi:hypothetical protein
MLDKLEKSFDVALEIRNLEISLLWQRSLFFWGFISAAFVGYADIVKEKNYDPVQAVSVASFGFICSLAWAFVNRGSKYWQESWEDKLKMEEAKLLGCGLFTRRYVPPDTRWWGQWSRDWHFSVSRLAMALSDFTVAVWVVLVLRALPGSHSLDYFNDWIAYLIPVATLIYGVIMWKRARS